MALTDPLASILTYLRPTCNVFHSDVDICCRKDHVKQTSFPILAILLLPPRQVPEAQVSIGISTIIETLTSFFFTYALYILS